MALARIGVLVEVRAVEETQAVRIPGEVRRHPVEDHADARLVQVVDEPHEVLRRAVARARREVAGALVAPRAVERVLHDRHQLDVGEAHALRVLGELGREVAVAEEAVGMIGRAHPGAEVHLVDRLRRVERVARGRACASIRRRAIRSRGPRPSSRSSAASRSGTRTDRPCRLCIRRAWTRCGTCKRFPASPRARGRTRCRRRRSSGASDACADPSR